MSISLGYALLVLTQHFLLKLWWKGVEELLVEDILRLGLGCICIARRGLIGRSSLLLLWLCPLLLTLSGSWWRDCSLGLG